MRWRLGTTLLTLASALAFASPALAGDGANASVQLTECRASDGMPSAEFVARMRAVPGTRRMAMRFVLQERAGGEGWRSVEYGPLEDWRRSRTLVRMFSYRQRVANLEDALAYRVVVRFRWFDEDGPAIQSAVRRSVACAPLRPDEPAPPASP
jgi:hypothetical protein